MQDMTTRVGARRHANPHHSVQCRIDRRLPHVHGRRRSILSGRKRPALLTDLGLGPRHVAWLVNSSTTHALHRPCRVLAGGNRSQPVRSVRKCLLWPVIPGRGRLYAGCAVPACHAGGRGFRVRLNPAPGRHHDRAWRGGGKSLENRGGKRWQLSTGCAAPKPLEQASSFAADCHWLLAASHGKECHEEGRGVQKLDRHAAARSYSSMRPPSRSRRLT
jgi:hypothetical protein